MYKLFKNAAFFKQTVHADCLCLYALSCVTDNCCVCFPGAAWPAAPHKGGSRCQALLQHPGGCGLMLARRESHGTKGMPHCRAGPKAARLSLPCMCLNPVFALQETASCLLW